MKSLRLGNLYDLKRLTTRITHKFDNGRKYPRLLLWPVRRSPRLQGNSVHTFNWLSDVEVTQYPSILTLFAVGIGRQMDEVCFPGEGLLQVIVAKSFATLFACSIGAPGTFND